MKQNFDFFKTKMPESRKADFYLGCLDGAVFLDFNKTVDNRIRLCRISFDGYGCCNLPEQTNALNAELSKTFMEEITKEKLDQEKLALLVKEVIKINQAHIWVEALESYHLIDK
jgi:hypothetical protein